MGWRDFDHVSRSGDDQHYLAGIDMFLFKKQVVQLPKFNTSSGAELAAKANVHPDSQALLKPGMTSSEYIHTLEGKKQSVDAVKALAHGMPERDSVSWACQSSQKVADKLNPQELAATKAAEEWVKSPTDANKMAAGEAASRTDFKGPGGWAAQAAAWSQKPAPAAGSALAGGATSVPTRATATPATSTLTPAAVSGVVLLAAGLCNRPAMSPPQKPNLQAPPVTAPPAEILADSKTQVPPVDQSKMAKLLQPFIDLGKDIASGKNSRA